jgi:membrane fusion protein (multidrug efflux system)
MSKNKLYITLSVLVILALAIVAYKIMTAHAVPDSRRQNIAMVKVELPRRDTVTYKLQFRGDISAIRQASIFSKVGGNLEHVYVDMGSAVKSNQLLALIDTTELHQQYQQAAATFQNARLTFQRTKELFEQNLVARQDIDNADAAMKVSRANFETAATRLGYARITAPFAGFITRRYLDPGALVTLNNTTLFMLMDIDAVKVIINILEKDIPLLRDMKKAVVTVDAFPDKEFYGSVTRYSQAVELSTRTMAVEIDIPNKDHVLKPGMFANVILIVDEHLNAITIPTQAVLKDDRGSFVYLAVKDTAKRRLVNIGVEQNSRTEILSGLNDTDSTITTGQQFVKEGAPISIQRQ